MLISSRHLVETPAPAPPVDRSPHQFDFENPIETFVDRLKSTRVQGQAIWLGPHVTVSCQLPTKEFWRVVYAQQGAWMKEARSHFGRRQVESPESWMDPHHPGESAEYHRIHRRACLTGYLRIGSMAVSQRYWPTRQQVGYKPRRRLRKRV